jgi:hypothetical protein
VGASASGSRRIGALYATRGTEVYKLGAKLGIDPMELLRMINGKVMPTKANRQRSCRIAGQ